MEDNFNQMKKRLLNELGYKDYMDKQKIRDDLDAENIKKELDAINKRKKYRMVSIILIHIILISIVLSQFYDKYPIISNHNLIGTFSFLAAFLILINLTISQAVNNTKREMLFRLLSVFNK